MDEAETLLLHSTIEEESEDSNTVSSRKDDLHSEANQSDSLMTFSGNSNSLLDHSSSMHNNTTSNSRELYKSQEHELESLMGFDNLHLCEGLLNIYLKGGNEMKVTFKKDVWASHDFNNFGLKKALKTG